MAARDKALQAMKKFDEGMECLEVEAAETQTTLAVHGSWATAVGSSTIGGGTTVQTNAGNKSNADTLTTLGSIAEDTTNFEWIKSDAFPVKPMSPDQLARGFLEEGDPRFRKTWTMGLNGVGAEYGDFNSPKRRPYSQGGGSGKKKKIGSRLMNRSGSPMRWCLAHWFVVVGVFTINSAFTETAWQ
jgi:hypothetical protein